MNALKLFENPELTAEERAERQQKVEKCIADFWLAVQKAEQNGLQEKW